MKKGIFLKLLLTVILMWIIMTGMDYIEENSINSYFYICYYIVPVVLIALYYGFHTHIYDSINPSWKSIAKLILSYDFIHLVIGLIISYLVLDDKWIIPQAYGGWEHFLNGIEYFIALLFYILIPSLSIIISEFAIYLIRMRRGNIK